MRPYVTRSIDLEFCICGAAAKTLRAALTAFRYKGQGYPNDKSTFHIQPSFLVLVFSRIMPLSLETLGGLSDAQSTQCSSRNLKQL